jgi:hypothetical protein
MLEPSVAFFDKLIEEFLATLAAWIALALLLLLIPESGRSGRLSMVMGMLVTATPFIVLRR